MSNPTTLGKRTVSKSPTAEISIPSPMQTGLLFSARVFGIGKDEGVPDETAAREVVMVVKLKVVKVLDPEVIVSGMEVVKVVKRVVDPESELAPPPTNEVEEVPELVDPGATPEAEFVVVEGGGVDNMLLPVEIGELACDEELSLGGGGGGDADEDGVWEGGGVGAFAGEGVEAHCCVVGSLLRLSMCAR